MESTSIYSPLNVTSPWGGNIAGFSTPTAGKAAYIGMANTVDQTACYFGIDGGLFIGVSPGGCIIGTYNDPNLAPPYNNPEFIIIGARSVMYRFMPTYVIPANNNAADLGSSSFEWKNIFVNNLTAVSGTINVCASLLPTRGNLNLGSGDNRWDNIYLCNAPIISSDERKKSNIAPSDLGLEFIDKLKPVKYNFIGGNRTHYGLTTQQVKRTLEDLSCHDFAGFVLADKDDPDSAQMLRYEEFISPIIQSIQDLKEIVNRQQKQIEDLMSRV
jgi:hypothetical protein